MVHATLFYLIPDRMAKSWMAVAFTIKTFESCLATVPTREPSLEAKHNRLNKSSLDVKSESTLTLQFSLFDALHIYIEVDLLLFASYSNYFGSILFPSD